MPRPGKRSRSSANQASVKRRSSTCSSGFYFPQKGHILVDGIDIEELNLKEYRSRIGTVPQEPTLFNDTIEANIRYGNPGKSHEEMVAACKDAYAQEFIEAFPKKYKTIVGWRGVKLSIGQKQRIALARAFLRSPDILVLDEPTSALDAKSEHLIKASFEKLMQGRTTFIIAHRLSTVREADLILVLKNGEIVEQGNHAALMSSPAASIAVCTKCRRDLEGESKPVYYNYLFTCIDRIKPGNSLKSAVLISAPLTFSLE